MPLDALNHALNSSPWYLGSVLVLLSLLNLGFCSGMQESDVVIWKLRLAARFGHLVHCCRGLESVPCHGSIIVRS